MIQFKKRVDRVDSYDTKTGKTRGNEVRVAHKQRQVVKGAYICLLREQTKEQIELMREMDVHC